MVSVVSKLLRQVFVATACGAVHRYQTDAVALPGSPASTVAHKLLPDADALIPPPRSRPRSHRSAVGSKRRSGQPMNTDSDAHQRKAKKAQPICGALISSPLSRRAHPSAVASRGGADGQADRTRLQPPGQPEHTHQSLRLPHLMYSSSVNASGWPPSSDDGGHRANLSRCRARRAHLEHNTNGGVARRGRMC